MKPPASTLFEKEQEFLVRFLEDRGAAFQTLFQEIMERAHPDDFRPVRAHGSVGDKKCDGYLASEQVVFQVYAPGRGWRLGRLLSKIREDYLGACEHWPEMRLWVFVHNFREGLPADAVQLLDTLPTKTRCPKVGVWGYEELRRQAVATRSPGPRPSLSAMRRYWQWLVQEQTKPPPHLRPLQAAGLPIRLIRPDEDSWHPSKKSHRSTSREGRRRIHRQEMWEATEPNAEGAYETHMRFYHLVRKKRRVLIVGDSGSGKSALLQRFATNQAKRLLSVGEGKGGRHTSILVELWRFGLKQTLFELVVSAIGRSGETVPRDQVCTALELGYFVVLLDGLDEVSDRHQRECLAQVESLAEKFPKTLILLTSRPGTRTPPHFDRLHVADLCDDDLRHALDNVWDLPPAVRDLCRRPLTLGFVMYALYQNKRIPRTLYTLYEQMEAWLLDWDVQKGRLRSAYGPSTALERTAYELVSADVPSLSESDWIRTALGLVSSSSTEDRRGAEDALKQAVSAGILRNEGGAVRFEHRSFRDYFAAKVIARSTDPWDHHTLADTGTLGFVASALGTVKPFLEKAMEACEDVRELEPLFRISADEELDTGRFEGLAAAFAEEVWPYCLSEEESVSDYAEWLIGLCREYMPKARSLTSQAAWITIYAGGEETMPRVFHLLAECLEAYGLRSSEYYRTVGRWVEDSLLCSSEDGSGLYFSGRGGGYETMMEMHRALEDEEYSRARRILDAFARWLEGIEEIMQPTSDSTSKYYRCPSTLDLFDR